MAISEKSNQKDKNSCQHVFSSRVFCWECSVIGCIDCDTAFPLKHIWNKSDRWLCPKCKDISKYAKIWKEHIRT